MSAAPDTTKTMVFVILITGFKMIGIIERLRNYIPLKRGAVAGINGKNLIGTPAHAAMIYDDIFSSCATKCIIAAISIYHSSFLVFISHTKTDDIGQ